MAKLQQPLWAHLVSPGDGRGITADHLRRQGVYLNAPFIQGLFDLMPIFWLAQVGQQMAQPVVTEIQWLDDLGGETAQGMVHALDIHFDRHLPVIAFCENMREPNDRRPSPTQPPLLPVARDMLV